MIRTSKEGMELVYNSIMNKKIKKEEKMRGKNYLGEFASPVEKSSDSQKYLSVSRATKGTHQTAA